MNDELTVNPARDRGEATRSGMSWTVAGVVSFGLHGWLAGFVAIWGHFAPGADAKARGSDGAATEPAMVIFLDSPSQTPPLDSAAAQTAPTAPSVPEQLNAKLAAATTIDPQSPVPAPTPVLKPKTSTPSVPAEMPMRLGAIDSRSEFAAAWLQSLVDGEHAAVLEGFDQAQLDQLASPDGSTGLRAEQSQTSSGAPGAPGEPGTPGAPRTATESSTSSEFTPSTTAATPATLDGPGNAAMPMTQAPQALRIEAQQAMPLLAQPKQEARPERPAIAPQDAVEPIKLEANPAAQGAALAVPRAAQPGQSAQQAQEEKPEVKGQANGQATGVKDAERDATTPADPTARAAMKTTPARDGLKDGVAAEAMTPPQLSSDPVVPVSATPQPEPPGLGVNPQMGEAVPTPMASAASAQQPTSTSAQAGQGGGGSGGGGGSPSSAATPSTAPRGPKADRDSDAASIRRSAIYRNGRVDAGKGLDIRTVRPEFSLTTRALSTPASPRVEIAFNRRGFVERVKVLTSSGYVHEVDQPIITALYNWRARGEVLDQLPPGPDSLLTLELTIVLR